MTEATTQNPDWAKGLSKICHTKGKRSSWAQTRLQLGKGMSVREREPRGTRRKQQAGTGCMAGRSSSGTAHPGG